MSRCNLPEQRLQAWLDGELDGERTGALGRPPRGEPGTAGPGPGAAPAAAQVAAHVAGCPQCKARVERLQTVQRELRGLVDDGLAELGDLEPLLAVREIHARLAARRAMSPAHRLSVWWTQVRTFHRAAVLGAAVAAAVGVLVGPALALLLGRLAERPPAAAPYGRAASPAMASVVVESLQFDGNSRAVVYSPEDSATTIIWVESLAAREGKRAEEF